MKLRLWFFFANCGVRKGEYDEQRVRWFLLGGVVCATSGLPRKCVLVLPTSNQNRVGKGGL